MPDETYWAVPQQTFEQRRQLFLEYCAADAPRERTGFFFSQIARLELGQGPLDEEAIRAGIAFVDSRKDCCDFAVGGFLRILYRYHDSPLISRELVGQIEACLLRFKYWWDEPEGDNQRCYWTENHQIIFHSDELLAGQLFRKSTFQNDGKEGETHIEHALNLIRRWMEYRERFGFSEWLSNCYFEEDLLGIVNLYDFAEQEDLRRRAGQLIDVILYEMALHTYRGVMGCSHGRTYPRLILGGRSEDAANTAKLMFGMGLFNKPTLGTIPLATSGYRCPPLIEKIAQDLSAPVWSKERHSFNVDDAPQLGISYDDLADANLYWSVQDYTHEKVEALSNQLVDTFHIWLDRDQYLPRYAQVRAGQTARYGRVMDPNVDCHAMTEVHIQTYRTGNYMLSCAQDYRPGKPGYQQHPWQATLGIDAVVFTNHPASNDQIARPNYWAGNGILPRAVQHKNVLVCLHLIWPDDAFPFSHAYFPRDAFNEVLEHAGWICARMDDGYIGMYASHPYQWLPDETGKIVEVRVESDEAVWLVEMGERSQWGSFGQFVQAVTGASIRCQGLQVEYHSPSQGKVEFSWEGDFRINDRSIDVHHYPRFDNPYCENEFQSPQVVIHRGDEVLTLNFNS